jgi:hypothetical protein
MEQTPPQSSPVSPKSTRPEVTENTEHPRLIRQNKGTHNFGSRDKNNKRNQQKESKKLTITAEIVCAAACRSTETIKS